MNGISMYFIIPKMMLMNGNHLMMNGISMTKKIPCLTHPLFRHRNPKFDAGVVLQLAWALSGKLENCWKTFDVPRFLRDIIKQNFINKS